MTCVPRPGGEASGISPFRRSSKLRADDEESDWSDVFKGLERCQNKPNHLPRELGHNWDAQLATVPPSSQRLRTHLTGVASGMIQYPL